MPDWEDLLKHAKEDVLCAVDVWSDILQETFGSRLEYAYAKGSAMKNWDSPIDYVPVISDLDIHIKMTDTDDLFPETSHGFSSSIEVSEIFEKRFLERRPEHIHVPRTQVVHINPNLDDPWFFLPRVSDVHVMVGFPKDATPPSSEDVRASDCKQIQDLREYLEDLPRQVFDLVGFDFWTMLRRMNWRVSPSPIRLLTQTHSNPLEVWNWNRTRIVEELKTNKYDVIVDAFQKFYSTGWNLFLSKFTNLSELRKIVVYGYEVLEGCLNEVNRLVHNQNA